MESAMPAPGSHLIKDSSVCEDAVLQDIKDPVPTESGTGTGDVPEEDGDAIASFLGSLSSSAGYDGEASLTRALDGLFAQCVPLPCGPVAGDHPEGETNMETWGTESSLAISDVLGHVSVRIVIHVSTSELLHEHPPHGIEVVHMMPPSIEDGMSQGAMEQVRERRQRRMRRPIGLVSRSCRRGVLTANGTAAYNSSCPICLEDLVPGDHVRAFPCNHQLHNKCFNRYYRVRGVNPTCVICRARVRCCPQGV